MFWTVQKHLMGFPVIQHFKSKLILPQQVAPIKRYSVSCLTRSRNIKLRKLFPEEDEDTTPLNKSCTYMK